MKIRLAKKILYSTLYHKKFLKIRPPYYDKNREKWVHPSWHNIPLVIKAKTRYYKWIKNGIKYTH